jgi:hypothetical protein
MEVKAAAGESHGGDPGGLFAGQNERDENEGSFGDADEDEGGTENDAHRARVPSDRLRGARSDCADADCCAASGETDFDS